MPSRLSPEAKEILDDYYKIAHKCGHVDDKTLVELFRRDTHREIFHLQQGVLVLTFRAALYLVGKKDALGLPVEQKTSHADNRKHTPKKLAKGHKSK